MSFGNKTKPKLWFVLVMAMAMAMLAFDSVADAVAGQSVADTTAPSVIDVTDDDRILIGGQFSFLTDTEHRLTIDDVSAAAFAARFTRPTSERPRYVRMRDPVWARFTLANGTDEHMQRLFVVEFTNHQRVSLFIPQSDGGFKERRTDSHVPVRDVDMKHRYSVYRLALPAQSTQTFYLRIHSPTIRFTSSLWSPEAFAQHSLRAMGFQGLLMGVVLCVSIYQLALAFLSGNRLVHFSLFVFAISAFVFQLSSFGHHNVYFGAAGAFVSNGYLFTQGVTAAAALFFSQVFLQLRARHPKIYVLNTIIIIMFVLTGLASLYSYSDAQMVQQLFIPLAGPMVIGCVLYDAFKGQVRARFYLIGWVPIVILAIIGSLDASGFLVETTLTYLLVPFGMSVGLLIFAFAVANGIGHEHLEKIALRESEQRMRNILATAPVAVRIIRENDGYVFFANHMAADLNQCAVEEMVGQTLTDTFPDAYALERLWNDFHADGQVRDREMELVDSAGGTHWVLLSMEPIQFGEEAAVLSWVYDITRLKEAHIQAEAADAGKTRFLAAASHDLRQPLQALSLFIAALSGNEHDDASRQLITKIERSLRAFEKLLNALLDISRLEAGLIKPVPAAVDFSSLMHRLCDEFTPQADAVGLELRYVVPRGLWVHSDATLLERVLRNLLTNAVRYTPTGRVLFGCRRRGDVIRIEIWDTGIGIQEGQIDRIFDDYFQADNEARNREKGLGLGLSIVNRLVSLLGHDLNVSSQFGKGSCFALEVPRTAAPAAKESQTIKVQPKPSFLLSNEQKFILVVDDDLDLLDALKVSAESWGYSVMTASSGGEALDGLAFRTQIPDLIISDYRLNNGETGDRAISAIREFLQTQVPALILTGDTAPDRITYLERSGLKVLHKPLRAEQLRDALSDL